MGELRQGAQASLVADAVAAAAGVPPAELRRALMLRGDLGAVAVVALTEGAAGLAAIRLVVGRPLAPMLASPAASIEDALATHSPASVEWKLDGARVQAHRDGDDVALFTRSLDDVTARLPEVVAAVRALPVRSLVADAEAILLRPDGRPAPFQETAERVLAPDGLDARRAAVRPAPRGWRRPARPAAAERRGSPGARSPASTRSRAS